MGRHLDAGFGGAPNVSGATLSTRAAVRRPDRAVGPLGLLSAADDALRFRRVSASLAWRVLRRPGWRAWPAAGWR
jgi:hypothetical protein